MYETETHELNELKNKYKHIDPLTLASHGLLSSARKSGWVCPNCGNGLGGDGTGIEFNLIGDGYKAHCFKCGHNIDVFDLIAAKYRYNVGPQFADVMRIAREEFGDDPKVDVKNPVAIKNFTPVNTKKSMQMKLDRPPVNYTTLITEALANLHKLFAESDTWRGLTYETMKRFFCGYIDNWNDGTKRVIIPTSYFHFLARLVGKNPRPNDSRIREKPHRGTKEIFGLKYALEALEKKPGDFVFAVEGEIDAMSIWQSGFIAIAFSGSSISQHQQGLLKKFPKKSKIILMLDADETGKNQTPILHNILSEIGLFVYDTFLGEKFHDSNDWLKFDPAGLRVELRRIYDWADEYFSKNSPPAVRPDYKIVEYEVDDISDKGEEFDSDVDNSPEKVENSAPKVENSVPKVENLPEKVENLPEKVENSVPKVENPPAKVENPLPEGVKRTNIEGVLEITPAYKAPPIKTGIGGIKPVSTTKTGLQIATCPLDLAVPPGYIFSPAGIKEEVPDKKNPDAPPKKVIVTHTPVIPTRLFAKKDDTDMHIEIAVYNRLKNEWKRHIVPKTTIANAREIVNLASLGVSITSGRARGLSDFLTDIQCEGDNAKLIPQLLMYEQTGWTSSDCEKFLYPPGEDDFIIQDGGFNYEAKFQSKGEKGIWQIHHDEVYMSSVAGRYAIGLVLAAPLVKLCRARNFQGVLVAPSGSGKSAVATLAMSIFGNPNKLKVTFNGTPNFTDEISPRLNDLPTWVDEFQAADENMRKNFQSVIFNYSEGKSRGRLKKNAETRKQFEFNGTRLCTAEHTVLQSNYTQGAFNRTFEIEVGDIMPSRDAVQLHRDLNDHYGFYGKKYIDYLIAHKKEVRKTYAGILEKYKNWNFIPAHIQHIALVYTGNEYFHRMLREAGDMKIELPDPLDILDREDIKYFRELLPSPQESNNIARVKDFLAEILVTHSARFDMIANDGAFYRAVKDSSLGCKFSDGSVGFYPEALDEFLAEHKYPSARSVMRGLDSEGLLIKANGDLGRKFKNSKRIDKRSAKFYHVKAEAFEVDEA